MIKLLLFVYCTKIISNSRDSDNLSIGCRKSNDVSEKELSNNKQTKGNYHVSFF